MNIFDRIEAGFDRMVAAGRKRAGWFDHFWRALERFNDEHAVRLAAAIAYYGFFAAFSLTVVAYSVLGRLLGESEAGFIATVNEYLSTQLSWVKETAERSGTQQVTVIGTVALVITGVVWIDALRSSTRALWQLKQHPGHWIIRLLIDLGMLLVLGVLLVLSLGATYAIDALLEWLAGPNTGAVGHAVLRASSPVLEFLVNLVLSAALLTLVPRLRLSPRRLFPTLLVVAVGIQVLNTAGRWYIEQLDRRPAYHLVTDAVGLLIYLYLLNQLILFGCALAATSTAGSMVDHGAGPDEPRSVLGAGRDEPRSVLGANRADDSGEPRGDGGRKPP